MLGTPRQAISALAALALASLAGCGFSTEEADGGPAEPEAEGITLYAGRIPAAVGGAVDMHEARVDRNIRVRFASSPDLAATLIEEGDASPADAFLADDSAALEAVAARDQLERLPRDILERVPPEYRDDDGYWVGLTGRVRVIAHHEDVARSALPASPIGLAEPTWEGRVGWAPPTGSFQDYVTALRLELGDERVRTWLEDMLANGVGDYPNNVAIRDAIVNGEIDAGLINHYYVAQAVAAEGPGYPVEVYFPPDGLGSLVLTTGIGVLRSSERKDEALAFVRSLLSAPAQRFFTSSSKEYPLAAGVERDPSLTVPLEDIPVPDGQLTDLSERQATIDLLQETGAL